MAARMRSGLSWTAASGSPYIVIIGPKDHCFSFFLADLLVGKASKNVLVAKIVRVQIFSHKQ
jgi:hypothetical protein